MRVFININFPLRAAFVTSHKLGYVVFPFSFVKVFFDFRYFFFDLLLIQKYAFQFPHTGNTPAFLF